jgi:putative phosphoesterase
MKILIVSDTHRKILYLEEVLGQVGAIDALIHLGDVEGQEEYIRTKLDCPAYIVCGNNDFFSNLPRELELELGGHRILLTHGHYYRVSMTTALLKDEAIARNCDIVMYGHTHKPEVRRESGVTLVNPGSLAYPRQENRKPSFILMEIDRKQEVHYTINYLEN